MSRAIGWALAAFVVGLGLTANIMAALLVTIAGAVIGAWY